MTQFRPAAVNKCALLIMQITVSEAALEANKNEYRKLDPKVSTYTFDLDQLNHSREMWQARLTESRDALYALENAEYEASYIRVISQGKKSAQIVVYTKDENGKKVSQTRHLRKDGDGYTGHSMFGLRIIKWNLNKTEPLPAVEVAEAA